MEHGNHSMKHGRPYVRLLVMAVLSFLAMYALMYAMVDAYANVFHSVNQVYMAGLMAAPMVILEIFLMGPMYGNKKLNGVLILGSLVVGIAFFAAIRRQTGVSDAQFVRSMIPHHAGAILMCKEASLQDPELKALCRSILAGQQSEIDQMKVIRDRL